MTNSCVVPKCRTGYKSFKMKRSIFKVPKDPHLLRKWRESIPGNAQLKSKHFVCERHFEERYINRQWIKRDATGKVIASFTYLRPRLHDGAVPTLFDDKDIIASKPTIMEKSTIKTECADTAITDFSFVDCFDIDKTLSLNNDQKIIKAENYATEYSPVVANISSIQLEEFSPTISVEANDDTDSMTGGHITEKIQQTFPKKYPKVLKLYRTPVLTSDLKSQKGCFNVSTSIISDHHELLKSGKHEETCSTAVPRFWGVTEMQAPDGPKVLFTYTVTRVKNGVALPVTQRSVIFDIEGRLRYYVYGNPVNEDNIGLVTFLNDTDSLPKVLQSFQYKNICNGMGNINAYFLTDQSAFKDYVDSWRAQECTLLSRRKRCDLCVKLRRTVLQKERNLNRSKTIHRALHIRPIHSIK